RGGATLLELLIGAVAGIRHVRDQQAIGRGAVEIDALALAIGTRRAADVRPLVPFEAEPAEVVEHAALALGGGALNVRVVAAHHERAVIPAGEQPVEQRRPRAADVQPARRARREADTHRGRCHGSSTIATAQAASPSPRPRAPSRSFVVAFTDTRPTSMPS